MEMIPSLKPNIAPNNGWLEDESSYWEGIFSVDMSVFGRVVTNLTFKIYQQTKMTSISEGQHPQNLHSKQGSWLGSRYKLQMVSNAPGYRPTETPPRPLPAPSNSRRTYKQHVFRP